MRIQTDDYIIHSLSKDSNEEVLTQLTFNVTFSPITCATYDNEHPAYFNITFSSIGIYDEVLVSCGLRRENATTVYDQFLAVVKRCKLINFNNNSNNLENVKKNKIN